VRRLLTCVIAVVAALSVFTVLATPAFDELPTISPHSAHLFAPTGAVILNPIVLAVIGQPPTPIGRVAGGTDLLLLTCARLC
jgi:hypothetical protein